MVRLTINKNGQEISDKDLREGGKKMKVKKTDLKGIQLPREGTHTIFALDDSFYVIITIQDWEKFLKTGKMGGDMND